MTIKQRIAFAALACASFAALAQQAPQQPGPLEPKAAVPALAYDSALKDYRPATPDEQATPDKAWRAANDQVADTGGHAGHGTTAPAHVHAPAPAPVQSAQSAATDHHKHH